MEGGKDRKDGCLDAFLVEKLLQIPTGGYLQACCGCHCKTQVVADPHGGTVRIERTGPGCLHAFLVQKFNFGPHQPLTAEAFFPSHDAAGEEDDL
eukprot:370946-Hanusia_phi.AAC.2